MRHVFFNEYATRPSGSIDKRLSAIAVRPAVSHASGCEFGFFWP
ncbi:MAG: hypothetical protein ACI89X_003744, partial [Planctomycetota bacterium]